MPVIKPYIRQKTIPAGEYAKAPANLTAGPALAIAKGAEDTEDILLRHMAKMKEEEDNLAIVDAAVTIGEKEIAFRKTHEEALSKAKSYDEATEVTSKLTKDFVDDLNKHVESASNNRRKIGISKLIKSAHLSVLDKTAASLAITRKSYIDASIMQTGDSLVNKVREGLMLPSEALSEYDAAVRSLKPAGEADKISYMGQQKIAGNIFEYKIKNNPSFVRELAKDPEKKKWWFDRLDPDKDYEGLFKRAVGNQIEDDADESLKTSPAYKTEDGKFDYTKAITDLNDPKVYKGKFGMTTKQASEYRNILKAEQAYDINAENRVTNEKYNKELDEIGELYINGNVKEAIKRTKSSDVIPGLEKARMIDHFKGPVGGGGGGGSNKETFMEAAEIMYDTSIPYERKREWLVKNANKLSKGEYKHWVTVGLSEGRTGEKNAVKAGINILKTNLLTPGMNSPTQKQRLQFAVTTFENGLREYHDRLNTPEEIKKYAYEILKIPQYQSNWREDNRVDMQLQRGVGMPESSTRITTGKKFMGYQNGKPVYDLGNGQAQIGD